MGKIPFIYIYIQSFEIYYLFFKPIERIPCSIGLLEFGISEPHLRVIEFYVMDFIERKSVLLQH